MMTKSNTKRIRSTHKTRRQELVTLIAKWRWKHKIWCCFKGAWHWCFAGGEADVVGAVNSTAIFRWRVEMAPPWRSPKD